MPDAPPVNDVRATFAAALPFLLIAVAALVWLGFRQDPPPVRVVFSAGSSTGEYYDFASALRDVARDRLPHIEIVVEESGGAAANAEALAAGEAQLGLVQSDTDIGPGARAVAVVFPEVLHIVARSESGIASLSDLAGKRIAVMPKGSGSNAVFGRVLDHYGYDPSDFELIPLPPQEAMEAVRTGRADGLARVIALGNAGMRDLLRDPELVLVPIDQAQAIEMFAPALHHVVIPRGALSGRPTVPEGDTEALSVSAILVARTDLPDAIVRDITALLFSARTALLERDPQTALMEGAEALERLHLRVHSGALAFYEADAPSFVVEYAEPLALGLSALAIIASGLWQAMRWAERRRKNRGDAYTAQIASLIDELRAGPTPEGLSAIEHRLYQIFHRVVDDIDNDRLAAETLPAFDFAWRSATELVARRHADNSPRRRSRSGWSGASG